MARVFVLQHIHSREDGIEDVKFIGVYSSLEKAQEAVTRMSRLIGVYSSLEKAQEAVTRMSRLPGFADAPDGFHIDDYRIDQDHWVEGYVEVSGA